MLIAQGSSENADGFLAIISPAGTATTVAVVLTSLSKCPRCWQYSVPVPAAAQGDQAEKRNASCLCGRCSAVLQERGLTAPDPAVSAPGV